MTGTSTGWERFSPRVLIAEGAQIAISITLSSIGLTYLAHHGSHVATVVMTAALLGYWPLRIAWILTRWALEKYRIAGEVLTVRTGVIRRQERQLEWASVVTVDESAGLFFRALRIRRMQLTQSDAIGGAVVFRALEAHTARDIRARVDAHSAASNRPAGDAQVGEVYRATWRELALMSVVNGRFAVLAPPVVLAVSGTLDDFGWNTWILGLIAQLPTAVVVTLSLVLFVLVGGLATITRYQGFCVRLTAQQTLVLSFGLLEKRERQIDLTSIEGITIRRSLVEQVLRRSRLAVLTVQGQDDIGSSVVLPSLPDAVVRQIARTQFRAYVNDSAILSDHPAPVLRQLVRAALVLGPAAAAAFILFEWGMSLGVVALGGLTVLGVCTAIGRFLVLRIRVDEHDILRVERPLASEFDTYVRARACHSASSLHRGAHERPLGFSLHLYAGGERHYLGLHCSADSMVRLRSIVAAVTEPAARRKRMLATTGGAS